MPRLNKLPLVMEIIWAIFTIALLAMSVHSTIYKGFSASFGVYALTLVSLGMYFFRRQRRRNQENNA